MMYGYWGKVLRVNLTTKKYVVEEVPLEVWKQFIGGSGYGAKVLLEETPPKVDPLSPENKIIFAVGAWQSVNAPGNAKWSLVTKSPLTKTFLDSAGAGHWAPLFKKAGYDALIIEGKNESPIYLYITEDDVQFKDASHIWGKDTIETTKMIKQEIGNTRVSMLNIGPAGEICNPIACVTCDGDSFAGRGGSGAVLGSKKLKAIVSFGRKQVPVYDLEGAKRKSIELMKILVKQGASGTKDGTPQVVTPAEEKGDLPMKYWTQDKWADAPKISAPNYTTILNAKPLYCANCPIGCHRHIKIERPEEFVFEGSGPEYETLGMMGGSFLCSDLIAICKANYICNSMGIDTVSTGAWISFLAECWEMGLINEKDTDGLKIEWGDGAVLVKLTEKIAKLEGIGKWFEEGIQGASKIIGPKSEDLIVHTKNMDYPAHDPRCSVSFGVNYATGTRGACHVRGAAGDLYYSMYPELGIKEDETLDSMDKAAERTFIVQNINSFFNQLTICYFMFAFADMNLTQMLEIFNPVTGWDWTVDEVIDAGRRAFTIQRLINVRDGITKKDDILPKKMTIAAKEGGRKGKAPLPHNKALEEYYKLRAWDKNGIPTKESLTRLGLDEYIKYLI